jgi:hypothetical protein
VPWLSLVAVAVLVMACAPQAELEPADDADTPVTEEVAEAAMTGVELEVTGEVWQGDTIVTHTVTPVRVEISNASNHQLLISYDNFSVLGAAAAYEVISPFVLDLADETAITVTNVEPLTTVEVVADGFLVAPWVAPAYADFEVYDADLEIERGAYVDYETVWAETGLPDEAMQAVALPEGVLSPGGMVSGYVYFEKLDEVEENVNLMFQLEDAGSGELFGTLTIPMEYESPGEI